MEVLMLGRGRGMVALEGACSKNVPATSIFVGELLKLQSSIQICNSKWVLGIYIYKFSKEFVVSPGLGAPLAVISEELYSRFSARPGLPGKLVDRSQPVLHPEGGVLGGGGSTHSASLCPSIKVQAQLQGLLRQ